jgi:competence protein ComEA
MHGDDRSDQPDLGRPEPGPPDADDTASPDPLAPLRRRGGRGRSPLDIEAPGLAARVSELRERLGDDPLARGAALVVAAVVGAVVVVALLAWPGGGGTADRVVAPTLPFVSTTVESTGDEPPTELVVHAAGAVASPGVYRLSPSARVADLVAAAGGLAPDADGDRVNLASPLADGVRLYVPRVGETAPPPVDGGIDDVGSSGDGTDGGLVDINRASAKELEELPGIGPATSAAIVSHRDEHGPFRAVDDLIDVRGIGPAKLEQLRDLVRV